MKTIMEEFFERRFGKDHPHDSYYQEWIGRFATGNPENYMDVKSKLCYRAALIDKIEELKKSIMADEQAAMAMGED